MRLKSSLLFLVISAVSASAAQAQAGAAPVVDTRWQASFDAFAEADRANAPTPGGVVFVGSSSIRLWDDLESQFDLGGLGIVKRGFGGSRMADCRQHVSKLVLPYKPQMVVVYAGDNDLAEGRSPQQIRDDFIGFVEGVRKALPHTRIAYLSIKPSPLRASLLPAVRHANALIADYAASMPNLDYIDVFTKMLDADGRPRADLYGADSLHLNATGYALWKSVIGQHLQRLPQHPQAPLVVSGAR